MTGAALLEHTPKPTDAQIRDAMAGIKCRCGTHVEIMQAALRAVQLRAQRAALQAPPGFPSSSAGEVQP